MKLNQELIDRLAKGEILLQHTGTVEQLNVILKAAAPKDKYNAIGISKYYGVNNSGEWVDRRKEPREDTPIYTTEQFLQVPDVRKTIDTETRELAKRLFVGKMYAGHLPTGHAMKQAIQNAKDFIKLLNEQT